MTLKLKREDWFHIMRDVDWTFSYVDRGTAFPESICGSEEVPAEAWSRWDEPYKVSYMEYVATQREKEAGAYAVKNALQRSKIFDSLEPGWKSAAKLHFGAASGIEYQGVSGEARMGRFGLSPAWRNVAIFGALDEIRHNQISLYFAHEFIAKDPQYDWAQKTHQTEHFAAAAARRLIDCIVHIPVVDIAIALPFTFETGFTNLQFIGLSADALSEGDVSFANMISSIQTDEARHAQQGGPTLEILMEHDPKRAQWIVDKQFWLTAKGFALLTGLATDYYTPLENRRYSYKEFMEEWVMDQFVRNLQDYGLEKPWYWDQFIDSLDIWHHNLNIVIWFYRSTVWWNPAPGVTKDERDWLQEKYPNWKQHFGDIWDLVADNLGRYQLGATYPETIPWLCDMCLLPIGMCGAPNSGYPVRSYTHEYHGKTQHFCSTVCRQIWWADREMVNHLTFVDRMLAGKIENAFRGEDEDFRPDILELLPSLGMTTEVIGDDAYDYRWVDAYRAADGS